MRYGDPKNNTGSLSPISLRFSSLDMEQRYISWNYDKSLTMIRVIGIFTILIHFVLFPIDISILGEDAKLVWISRFALLVPAAALVVLLSYTTWFKQYHQFIISVVVFGHGLVFASFIMIFHDLKVSYFVAGVVTVIMFDFALLGVRFFNAVLNSWAIIIYSAILVYIYRLDPQMVASELYSLLVSAAILTVSAYKLELTSRTSFSHLVQKLDNEKAKMDAEASRINWLQSIAQLLRHEMRNALAGVNTSLELLTRGIANSEDIKYVERAKKGMKTIGSLLDSVSSATSIESAFYADDTMEVELCHLIKDQVAGYRMIYPNVSFGLVLPEKTVTIRGNEERLYQMLDNLVSNAVDHHQEGTPVVVELDTKGNECRLTVSNVGVPLPDDRNAMFDLFSSFRERPRLKERRGIGLYVVKLIAEGYGGAVEARDAEKGASGAAFRVTLPVVA